jgi:integrase
MASKGRYEIAGAKEETAMSKRGSGGLYLRGTTWWIRYYVHGREFRESAKTDSETIARKVLTKRIKESGRRGKFVGPSEDRLTFENLAEAIESDYTVNGLRSLRRLRGSLKHLRRHFGADRAVDITADRIRSYARHRCEKEKAASATVNRELAAMKRAFTILVEEDEVLSRSPKITMLDEHNTRQGFLEHPEFCALRDALPDRLRDPVIFLYLSAWRVSEMKTLEWCDVDLDGAAIKLPPAKSKNKDGRNLPLSGELAQVIERAHKARRLDCPFVFHVNGKPILDFRGAWAAAVDKAKLGKLLVHDLRRTGVRNYVRGGVPERVAMALSGHKTRSTFERYNIVSGADLASAVERRDQYIESRPTIRTVVPIAKKRGN